MSERTVVVLGGGGHASVVVDLLEEIGRTPAGITDPDSSRVEQGTIHGVEYLGDDDVLSDLDEEPLLVNGIASTGTPERHRAVYTEFRAHDFDFLELVHPEAHLAKSVSISEGSQVFAGAVVQPNVTIEENVVINTGASVDHDTRIGSHAHVAPGATLSGNVKIDPMVHVGAGAVVIQNTHIAQNSTVGAGAVVIDDVPPNSTVVGNPAEVIDS